MLLTLTVFVIISIATVLAQVIEVPVNPYHIVEDVYSFVFVNGNEYFYCSKLRIQSDWDVEATHWSIEVSVSNAQSITSFSQLDTPFYNKFSVKGFAAIQDSRFKPNQIRSFDMCVNLLEGKSFKDTQVFVKLLLYFGTELTEYPSTFVPPKTGQYFQDSNVCLPKWGDLSNYDVFAENFGPITYSRIGGRVAVKNDAIINNLWDLIDSRFCDSSCTGEAYNRLSEASIIVGGQIKGWTGENGFGGFCQGFIQGDPTISMSQKILNTVKENCPSLSGTSILDFDQMVSDMNQASMDLAGLSPNGLLGFTNTDGYKIHLWFTTNEGSNIQAVFNIPTDLFNTADTTQFELRNVGAMSRPEIIVFNIGGSQVTINDFNGVILQNYMNKVIYNFYEATVVSINAGTVYGTILAPKALVRLASGGTVEGSVFSKSFEGFQLTLQPNKWTGMNSDGECIYCSDGFYGEKCDACTCAYNEVCNDGIDGNGICVCSSRWNADCTECQSGNYGYNCLETCSASCLSYGTCNEGETGDGSCVCTSPWEGDECDQCAQGYGNFPSCDVCDNAHYGADCEFECSSSCATNGECSSGFNGTGECLGCRNGFLGEECDKCEPGFYGPDCSSPCNSACLENGQCDEGPLGTGKCICRSGVSGSSCTRCAVGGMYGPDCTQACSKSCVMNGFCNEGIYGDGRCVCRQGYSGEQCEEGAGFINSPAWFLLFACLSFSLAMLL